MSLEPNGFMPGTPMFFFTRCFLCIGAIVALAEGVNLSGLVGPAQDVGGTLARGATAEVQRYCRETPATCLSIAATSLRAAQDLGGLPGHADPSATTPAKGIVQPPAKAPAASPAASSHPGSRRPGRGDAELSLRHASPK